MLRIIHNQQRMTTSPANIVHLCNSPLNVGDYLQVGTGLGRHVLIVGEAPAPNGWRLSGRAFYTTGGRLLPSGVRLNELLQPFGVTVETSHFTELVKCFVGDRRSLLRSCAAKTFPLLEQQIKSVDPKLIIFLGKATHDTLERCVNSPLPFGEIHTRVIGDGERALLSIYHPSPISPIAQTRNREIFARLSMHIAQLVSTSI